MRKGMRRLAVAAVAGVLRAYKVAASPIVGPACRFVPSCSEYALEAVERYGPIHGLWLGARRVCRCHPFNPGGWDPVR